MTDKKKSGPKKPSKPKASKPKASKPKASKPKAGKPKPPKSTTKKALAAAKAKKARADNAAKALESAPIDVIFRRVVTDVYAVADSDKVPEGTTMTVDLEVKFNAIHIKKSGGIWGVFQKKKVTEQSSMEIRLATRIVVTKEAKPEPT